MVKKGSIGAWLIVLAMGWSATFLWAIFTTITVEHIYPWADDKINDTDAQDVLDKQIDYHNSWPLLLMVGLTLFAIVSSVKREPTEGYVGM